MWWEMKYLTNCIGCRYEFIIILVHKSLHVRMQSLRFMNNIPFVIHNLLETVILWFKRKRQIHKSISDVFLYVDNEWLTLNNLFKYMSELKFCPLISYGFPLDPSAIVKTCFSSKTYLNNYSCTPSSTPTLLCFCTFCITLWRFRQVRLGLALMSYNVGSIEGKRSNNQFINYHPSWLKLIDLSKHKKIIRDSPK